MVMNPFYIPDEKIESRKFDRKVTCSDNLVNGSDLMVLLQVTTLVSGFSK